MDFLLEKVDFHCHVNVPEDMYWSNFFRCNFVDHQNIAVPVWKVGRIIGEYFPWQILDVPLGPLTF